MTRSTPSSLKADPENMFQGNFIRFRLGRLVEKSFFFHIIMQVIFKNFKLTFTKLILRHKEVRNPCVISSHVLVQWGSEIIRPYLNNQKEVGLQMV